MSTPVETEAPKTTTAPPRHSPPIAEDEREAKRAKSEVGEKKSVDAKSKSIPIGSSGDTETVQLEQTVEMPTSGPSTIASETTSTPSSSPLTGDVKRIHSKHLEYQQSQQLLGKLLQLFPLRTEHEANTFLLLLAQLPVAMHRPRAVTEHGWRAAGEILTVQYDEKIPNVFKKMIENNISCVPVLDKNRRFIGLIDTLSLTIHALKSFGVMDENASIKDTAMIAAESIEPITGPSSLPPIRTDQSDTEMKIEQMAAEGSSEVRVSTASGVEVRVRPTGPVHVAGGKKEYAGRPIWTKEMKPSDKSIFADRWQHEDFKEANALTVLRDVHRTLCGASHSSIILGGQAIATRIHEEAFAPCIVQGASTLFAIELLARHGLHRSTILDSERFVTGLITESMIISLISQYKHKIPSFLSMSVRDIIPFLIPHRLMTIAEDAVTVEAFVAMVNERITGAAIVNANSVLVGSLSTRDLRGIGRSGADFDRLWMIVSEYKEATRVIHPDKTPSRVHFVTPSDTMVDVISNFEDGNLHRCFICDTSSSDELPRPIAVITQRDVMRLLLVFLGQTLQGEIRVTTA